MASADPDIASAAARIAALSNLAKSSPQVIAQRMAHARAVQHQKDLQAVDPDGVLDDAERERLAALRRRERLARAGLASARARRVRREAEAAVAQLAEDLTLALAEGGAA